MKKRYFLSCVLALTAVAIFAADEISVTTILKVDNGDYKVNRSVQNYKTDQTTSAADQGIMVSGASTNNVPVNNVTTPHYCFFRSLDTSTTNAIFIVLTVRLEAGDVALLPISSTNVTTYTTNGNASLEYWINAK